MSPLRVVRDAHDTRSGVGVVVGRLDPVERRDKAHPVGILYGVGDPGRLRRFLIESESESPFHYGATAREIGLG